MNFYEHQDRARKQTFRLLILFTLTLLALIVLTAFFIASIATMLGFYNSRLEQYDRGQSVFDIALNMLDWQFLGSVALAIGVVVGIAALFRMMQLSSGGKAIAEQLGGRLINSLPRDASEQKLLNVVEEMSIAAGLPVPSVYLIDEPGINAFAAGYQSADAVIGVTKGAVDQLSRHELQGVIAHEFSHIINGDMRLNLRLIALIYGIVVIALSGRYVLHAGRFSRKDRGASLSIGIVLIVLGYIGVLLGNIVKAAISRQREFLADASAVQFTRSQEGISGALKKIGGQIHRQEWQQHDANEISHMLFSEGQRFYFFNRLMSTHPPLDKRIKRIDPRWSGEFTFGENQYNKGHDQPDQTNDLSNKPNQVAANSFNFQTGQAAFVSTSAAITDIEKNIHLSDDVIENAKERLDVLKVNYSQLCKDIHQPYNARSLVFAMLVDQHQSETVRAAQWQMLNRHQQESFVIQTQSVGEQLRASTPLQTMMLLDLALPVLKLLSDDQYQHFKRLMLDLIKIDKKIELREWALFNLVNYYCRPPLVKPFRLFRLHQRKPALAKLLSALVHLSVVSEKEAKTLFNRVALNELAFTLRWYEQSELSIQSLSESLAQLRHLKPLEKPRFLKACIRVIEHDGMLEARELEVVNCIAQAMDCPMPSLETARL